MDRNEFFKPIVDAVNLIDDAKRTALPDWDPEIIRSAFAPKSSDRDSLWNGFKNRFELVHGNTAEGVAPLVEFLKNEPIKEGYLDPKLNELFKGALNDADLKTHDTIDQQDINRYEFGITRAAGVIAESGTIILKENSTSSRLGALSPWIHVAVLEEDTPIYATIYDAIEDFANDPYIIFVTGPSKTADVEGILIEGVHGPGIQYCCRI